MRKIVLALIVASACITPRLGAQKPPKAPADTPAPWKRHVIDDSSKGADGVRLADINGDGLMDIATGWEEGGVIRTCINPGPDKARQPWPGVTVGKVKSAEDAVFADLDGDGACDVVSCCEGGTKTVFIHWAPADKKRTLDPDAWTTTALPATARKQAWMFALPMQLDGAGGVDLVVGSKGGNGSVGYLLAPKDPRDVKAWTFRPLRQAGWIMSLVAVDMDKDGDLDVLVSDRKGKNRGVFWLANPGAKGVTDGEQWTEHTIGGADTESMFLAVADIDGDGLTDVLAPTRNGHMILFRRKSESPITWEPIKIANPFGEKYGKAVNIGDIDLDGKLDIVHTTNTLAGKGKGPATKPAVAWMSYRKSVTETTWQDHDISGRISAKLDLVELIDLDGDGDLDVLTCEERLYNAVIWYENPTR